MSDQNKKTTENSGSSRFDHKSQGMRTRSKNAAASSQKAKAQTITAAEIKETAQASESTAETSKVSAKVAKAFSDESFEENPSIAGAQKRFQAAISEENEAAVSEGNGAEDLKEDEADDTVIMSKSDIPAYEIGITSDEYYVPKEIQTGKVSKISEDQFDEIISQGPKKKQSKKAKKKAAKKKKSPLQRALKAVIWVAVWLIVFLIAAVCYKITYNVFYDIAVDPDSTATIEYTVTADATDESVYADLEELGVMNCTEFIYKLRAIVFDAEYVEGTYYISDGYNIEKIINILAGYTYSDD